MISFAAIVFQGLSSKTSELLSQALSAKRHPPFRTQSNLTLLSYCSSGGLLGVHAQQKHRVLWYSHRLGVGLAQKASQCSAQVAGRTRRALQPATASQLHRPLLFACWQSWAGMTSTRLDKAAEENEAGLGEATNVRAWNAEPFAHPFISSLQNLSAKAVCVRWFQPGSAQGAGGAEECL